MIGTFAATILLGAYHLATAFKHSSVAEGLKKQVRKQYDRGDLDKVLGEQRLKLTAQELVRATDYQTAAITWAAVQKIAITADHAFFYHNAAQA
ncbi:MAG TPA: hypothetical protein VMS17_16700, partial [Gemmataceae bacterium]|nr:hypothetical protein [Gemmataceae bacterium]